MIFSDFFGENCQKHILCRKTESQTAPSGFQCQVTHTQKLRICCWFHYRTSSNANSHNIFNTLKSEPTDVCMPLWHFPQYCILKITTMNFFIKCIK